MSHISSLAILDHLNGKGNLTTLEVEHIRECDDCRGLNLEIEQTLAGAGDIAKLRRFVAEEGRPPTPETAIEVEEDESAA